MNQAFSIDRWWIYPIISCNDRITRMRLSWRMAVMKDAINFDSHIPYYIQLMDILREKVQQKAWTAGDQIPGEKDLCEHYQVSRTVVRQALRELEFEGVIC